MNAPSNPEPATTTSDGEQSAADARKKADAASKRKAGSSGQSDGEGASKRRRKTPVVMAGPIPLLNNPHHQRNNPERFVETSAPQPIDVDGLSEAAAHPALARTPLSLHRNAN